MRYGIREVWYKKNGVLIPVNKGAVKVGDTTCRVKRMFISIRILNKNLKFRIQIGGSHPSPNPHIRMEIRTKYFTYQQDYGNYTVDMEAGTSVTSITSTSSGAHDVSIEGIGMPLPLTVCLVQNTIQSNSKSNYLITEIDGVLANTQFWSDDTLISVDMSPQGYVSTPVMRMNLTNDNEITFESLLPGAISSDAPPPPPEESEEDH